MTFDNSNSDSNNNNNDGDHRPTNLAQFETLEVKRKYGLDIGFLFR
jgi:hypothetical protein